MAIFLSANTQLVTIVDDAKFNFAPVTQVRTVSVHYMSGDAVDDPGDYQVLLGLTNFGAGSSYQVVVGNNAGDKFVGGLIQNSAGTVIGSFSCPFSIVNSQWYRLVLVASTNGNCKIYIDGVSQTVSHNSWDDTTGMTPATIWVSDGTFNNNNLNVAHLAVFTDELTQTEVDDIGSNPYCMDSNANVILSIHFDEMTGTIANDVQTVTTSTSGSLSDGIAWVNASFPKEIITVVDPDAGAGYDYDALADWEADLGNSTDGDLPTYDEQATAKCRCTGGSADTGGHLQINGWTTDATRYIKIWTDPSESYRHTGKWDTSKYRITSTSWGEIHWNKEAFVRIFGIQFGQNITGRESDQAPSIINIHTPGDAVDSSGNVIYFAYNVINIYGTPNNPTGSMKALYASPGTIGASPNPIYYVYNNLIVDESGYSGYTNSFGMSFEHRDQNAYVYNNTIVNFGYGGGWGISGASAADDRRIYTKNNLIYGCVNGRAISQDAPANSDYNATNVADIGYVDSAHDRAGQTFTFAGTGDYHLGVADTGARTYGLADPGTGLFSDDIDGAERGDTWDIGADEYISTYHILYVYSSGEWVKEHSHYVFNSENQWDQSTHVYVVSGGEWVPA
jgi:hypothetical protein